MKKSFSFVGSSFTHGSYFAAEVKKDKRGLSAEERMILGTSEDKSCGGGTHSNTSYSPSRRQGKPIFRPGYACRGVRTTTVHTFSKMHGNS